MQIVRNSVRLTALVVGLSLAGCGSAADHAQTLGDCDPDTMQKGCVMIMNWRSTGLTFAGWPIPAKHAVSGSDRLAPGLAGIKVSDTSLNSTHDFQGKIGGQDVTVTCTVTSFTWTDVNPEVVIQQEALGPMVNCQFW